MIGLSARTCIWLAAGVTKFARVQRLGFEGADSLEEGPYSGDVFVFSGRRSDHGAVVDGHNVLSTEPAPPPCYYVI